MRKKQEAANTIGIIRDYKRQMTELKGLKGPSDLRFSSLEPNKTNGAQGRYNIHG